MPWKLRAANGLSPEEEVARMSDTERFTLKFHHSGKFRLRDGKKVYVEGRTDYVDYCKKSELGMEDFSFMAAQIGLAESLQFYYSCSGADDCETLVRFKSLYCLDGLDCFISKSNSISVFVDHENFDERAIDFDGVPDFPLSDIDDDVSEDSSSSMQNLMKEYELPDIDDDVTQPKDNERVEDEGAANDRVEDERAEDDRAADEGNGDEGAADERVADVEDDRATDEGNGAANERVAEGLSRLFGDQVDEDDSEGEVSCGEDSENSDYLDDSDGCYDDEEADFQRYVDSDEELGKNDDRKGKRPMTRSQMFKEKDAALKKSRILEEARLKKPAPNVHRGFKLFNPATDMDHIDFHVGLSFLDIPTFRMALKAYAVQNGRSLRFTLNRPTKVQANCKDKKCEWKIYGSRVPNDDTVQVKTLYDTHTCVRQEKITQADARYIADRYKQKLKSDPHWPVESMIEVIQSEMKCCVSRWQMYRMKHKVAEMGDGDELQQFASLYRYAEEIFRSNPTSTCKIKTTVVGDKAVFKRMYICWAALRDGMLAGCRRLICLDGCHLKTQTGGVLLTAVGIDSNNGMYPFSYVVVEKETFKSWLWFLDLVVKDLGISEQDSFNWTVMSDKQKGLVEAVSVVLPNCESRFCVRHLYANFKLSNKGVGLRDIVWRAARATRQVDLQRVMEEVKIRSPNAFDWISKRNPQHWSKAHFNTINNTDLIVNNLSESFNSMILRARGKPILKMLEDIRRILMKRIGLRRRDMLKHSGYLCPNIQKSLDMYKVKSFGWAPSWNGKDEFEVCDPNGQYFCVHLGNRTCGCRRWQLTGIPCQHSISCMNYMGYKPESYVDECYSTNTYLSIYDHYMSPMQGMEEWLVIDEDRLDIVPPKIGKMPSRPKKHKRKLEVGEVIGSLKNGKLKRSGLISTCQLCKQTGHNSRTCPQNAGASSKPTEGLDILPASEPVQKQKKKKARATSKPTQRLDIPPEVEPVQNNENKMAEASSKSTVQVPTRKSPRKKNNANESSVQVPTRKSPRKKNNANESSVQVPTRKSPRKKNNANESSAQLPTRKSPRKRNNANESSAQMPTRKSPRKKNKATAPSASQPTPIPSKHIQMDKPSASQPVQMDKPSSSQPTLPLNLGLASRRSDYMPLFTNAPSSNVTLSFRKFTLIRGEEITPPCCQH